MGYRRGFLSRELGLVQTKVSEPSDRNIDGALELFFILIIDRRLHSMNRKI